MQLKSLALATLIGLVLAAGPATAQSLQPMHKTGATPSDVKGFRLLAGNPYKQRMTFIALVMDPKFEHEIADASVQPAEFRLAPEASRPLIVKFKIPAPSKERTIAVCVLPKDIEGSILPRVCGTYTGRMLSAGAGG